VDELTNWYIRRSRRRFWKSEDDRDKQLAYHTLYSVLSRLTRLIAPFLPFVSEAMYQNMERVYADGTADSVHLATWPEKQPESRDLTIEAQMAMVKDIVSLARSLRNEGAVRVRQPLNEVAVAGVDGGISTELQDLILDELNVKSLKLVESATSLRTLTAKGDFKTLGPKFGPKAKSIAVEIALLKDDALQQLATQGGTITVAGEPISRSDLILSENAAEGYWVRTDNGITVAVDYRVDSDLRLEWLSREFVHHVQNMRRDADLEVTQRITVEYNGGDEVQAAISKHSNYIRTEVLANVITLNSQMDTSADLKIGDLPGAITIKTD
jgi:isoleucyl-tRNA synthetase